MNSKAVFSVVVGLLTVALASGDPIGRIVGGVPMSIAQAPYQVSLQMIDGDEDPFHFCGGSVINERHFDSESLFRLEPSDIAIVVGRTFNNQRAQRNQVRRIIMNSRYNADTQDNDVALLELNTLLTFSNQIQPIQLVNGSDSVPAGTRCLVTGWGDTNRNVLAGRSRLRGVEIPIVNHQTCNRQLHEYGGITPRMICAGRSGHDACQGDSGGPFACHFPNRNGNITLVGVVSWGIDCGTNVPGVYANLSSFRQWIRDQSGI